MNHSFSIENYSPETETVVVRIFCPQGQILRSFKNRQFAVSNDASELELVNALRELVNVEAEIAFPPPAPKPTVLSSMVGKTYD